MGKYNLIWIIGIIVLFYFVSQPPKMKETWNGIINRGSMDTDIESDEGVTLFDDNSMSVSTRRSLASCEDSRQSRTSSKCISPICKKITSDMVNCYLKFDTRGVRLGLDDVGKYGYVYDSDERCGGADTVGSAYYCMYGQPPSGKFESNEMRFIESSGISYDTNANEIIFYATYKAKYKGAYILEAYLKPANPVASVLNIDRNYCAEVGGESPDWKYRNNFLGFDAGESLEVKYAWIVEEEGAYDVYVGAWSRCASGGYQLMDYKKATTIQTYLSQCTNPTGESWQYYCNLGYVYRCLGNEWTGAGICGSGDFASYGGSCKTNMAVKDSKSELCNTQPPPPQGCTNPTANEGYFRCNNNYIYQCSQSSWINYKPCSDYGSGWICSQSSSYVTTNIGSLCKIGTTTCAYDTFKPCNSCSEYTTAYNARTTCLTQYNDCKQEMINAGFTVSGSSCSGGTKTTKYCTINEINDGLGKYKQGQLTITQYDAALNQYKNRN